MIAKNNRCCYILLLLAAILIAVGQALENIKRPPLRITPVQARLKPAVCSRKKIGGHGGFAPAI